MRTVFLSICLCLLSLSASAQTESSMSITDKEALIGYEYIGEVDYLTVGSRGWITTAYKWDVHLYGKPFGNTYIFKVYVSGAQKEKNKSIYTLSKNGDKYVYYPDYDIYTKQHTLTKVDITNYKYKTKIKDDNGYDISLYLNLPF